MSQPIVVIGSGMAGYFFIKSFRQLNSETPIVLVTETDGTFYSKPLLSTALARQKTADALRMNSAAEMAQQYAIEVHAHTSAVSLDTVSQQMTCRCGDRQFDLSYATLVLATGSQTRDVPIAVPDDRAWVRSVNSLDEYADFRAWLEGKQRIAVLGAGLVGCEFANDMAAVGHAVDVIAPVAFPLSQRVPEAVGQYVADALGSLGVQWRLNDAIEAVSLNDDRLEMTLQSGVTVAADGLLSAVGIIPNTQLAQSAGMLVKSGIVVDEHQQTSEPNVYALGDCVEQDGHVRQYVGPLMHAARVLAAVLNGAPVPAWPVLPVVMKTPACPVVMVTPQGMGGAWQIEPSASGVKALQRNAAGALSGFVLAGGAAAEKQQLLAELSAT